MGGVRCSIYLSWVCARVGIGRLGASVGILIVVVGCGPPAPLVANPIEPWEEQVEREQVAQREQKEEEERRALLMSQQRREGLGKEPKPDEHSVIVTTLADIVAFPFRGAAWLARTIL